MQGLLLWAAAASPGSSSRQGFSLPGEQDRFLHRILQPPVVQATATGHTWPAAGCRSPLCWVYLLLLLLASSHWNESSAGEAAALMPPFHHQYSQLTSSGTPYAFHSPTAVLPSVSTDVRIPSLLQTCLIFGSIFSLYIL